MTLRLAMVAVLAALSLGCATRVVPPRAIVSPVTVYIADYGRHSSLILPTDTGCLAEYAYGDWRFYALNQYRWYWGMTALIWNL